jgi:hypothetical protein
MWEELLTAANATSGGVTAIPGVEITTSDGHVLVFCAPERLGDLASFMTKLDFQEDSQGDRYTRVAIDEVAKRAAEFGGVAIPAHAGRRNTGFLTKAPHHECQAIFESANVLGIEIDSNAEVDWFTSRDRTKAYQQRAGYVQMRKKALEGTPAATRLASLLFSDAHSLEGVGKARDGAEKLTRIKMEHPSFDGFVAALHDPDARVVLEQPLPEIYPRVVGMRFGGGFLDGEEIAFAPNLTALIGGRGAGKSTAIEALRCACMGESSAIEGSDAWPQTIQIEYLDSFGARHLVQRDAGTGQSIEVLEDGTAVPMSIPLEGYEQDHVAEIIRSTDNDPRPLLRFLDRFVRSSAHEEMEKIRRQLDENAEELLPVFGAPAALKKAKEDLVVAQGQIRVAEQTKAKDALKWKRLLHSERQLREAILAAISAIDRAAEEVPETLDLAELGQEVGITDLSVLPAKGILLVSSKRDSVAAVLAELAASVSAWKTAGAEERKALRARLNSLIEEWEERDKKIEARIQRIVEALRAKGITPDLAHVNKLASAEATAQTRVTKRQSEVTLRSAGLLRRLRLAEDRLNVERNAFGKRVAQQFRDAGVEFSVGIKFLQGQLVHVMEEWLREGLGNRFLRGERVREFCESIHPIDLADDLRNGRTARLTALRDGRGKPFLSPNDGKEFVAHLASKIERIFSLETIHRDDEPVISLTQVQDAKSKTYPFRHLSFGQRASILLGVVLFSDDMHPLVIDQPEDHLDSAFIYEAVVQTLRRVKERRQVIVATHNANIAVIGDAELIVPLRSWAGKGRVRDRGSVDTKATRDRACKILEGGEDAYRRRGKMYGF